MKAISGYVGRIGVIGILICLLAMASLVHAQGTRVVLPSVGPVELKCAAAK